MWSDQLVLLGYWPADSPWRSTFQQDLSTATALTRVEHSRLYQSLFDSLSQTVGPHLQAIRGSLDNADVLLNPQITRESWNIKADTTKAGTTRAVQRNRFLIEDTLDSLHSRLEADTLALNLQLDALKTTVDHIRRRLDSVAVVETAYATRQERLSEQERRLIKKAAPSILVDLPLALTWLFLLFGFVPWYLTREGVHRFNSRAYDRVREEVTLYHRTNALLDRIQYHMTFNEGQETATSAGPFSGFGWARRRIRQTSRQVRPFTVLSLVEEYRRYMEDVVFHLQQGLGNKKLKIVIAVDELDKVLNIDRLHEMLKSLKAVFEIPQVYYLLSISEDALGTYRLRHIDTKNEIDSAFTHIFALPPMDAATSLAYFRKDDRTWPVALYGPAIVFGGGVPRDMNRLAQLFDLRAQGWSAPDAGLLDLWEEDQQALVTLLQQHPHLGDIWRYRWVEALKQLAPQNGDEGALRWIELEIVVRFLDALAQESMTQFIRENPCTGANGRQSFHQILSLLRALAVKAYIYHCVAQCAPRAALNEPSVPNDAPEIEPWLATIQPLQSAVFDLSTNPLGVLARLQGWQPPAAANSYLAD